MLFVLFICTPCFILRFEVSNLQTFFADDDVKIFHLIFWCILRNSYGSKQWGCFRSFWENLLIIIVAIIFKFPVGRIPVYSAILLPPLRKTPDQTDMYLCQRSLRIFRWEIMLQLRKKQDDIGCLRLPLKAVQFPENM